MVLVRRKKVVFKDLPDLNALPKPTDATSTPSSSTSLLPPIPTLDANGQPVGDKSAKQLAKEADPDVFYIKQTGEIFLDYDSYAARIEFYQQKTFQCEITSRNNLTFWAAYESERNEARILHAKFPEGLKGPVLKAVQFHVIGRLDELTELVHNRFSERYFVGEQVFINIDGDKYYARIHSIYSATNGHHSSSPRPPAPSARSSTSSLSPPPPDSVPPHELAGDLNVPQEQADEHDPPSQYMYRVQLIDGKGSRGRETKWSDTFTEKRCDNISRDRLSFSKSILRRFLRDCVDRSTLIGSPWIVKAALAAKYGVPTEMTEARKQGIEEHKGLMLDKRKKWRGNDDADGGNDGSSAAGDDVTGGKGRKRKIGDTTGGEDKPIMRKKPVKYPAEDFLCELSVREIKAGKITQRPIPSRELPFGDLFETFLMTWSCLNSLGKSLTLSSFSLDDYEASLHYSLPEPHPLMTEINATLLNLIIKDTRDGLKVKPIACGSSQTVTDEAEEMEIDDVSNWTGKDGLTGERVLDEARKVSAGWAYGGELKIKDGRDRWHKCLVGCLVERATTRAVPHLLDFLAHLIFSDEEVEDENPSWAVTDDDPNDAFSVVDPSQKYQSLHSVYKLEIVAFLCELAVQTKKVRDDMEDSTNDLTEVRKDVQEVRRQRRKLAEEKLALDGPVDPAALAKLKPTTNGDDDDDASVNGDKASERASERPEDSATVADEDEQPPFEDDDDLSELSEADSHHIRSSSIPSTPASVSGPASASGSATRAPSSRRETLLHQQLSKDAAAQIKSRELALAKSKAATTKNPFTTRARIDEEDARLAKEEDRLDREFRKQIHLPRSKPIGLDRFGNKVWWFDGFGSSSLIGQGGAVMWGTGRIFLQGGAEGERRRWAERCGVPMEEVNERREKEEGEEGMLSEGEWAVYEDPQQMTAFLDWLNPKGHREIKLLDSLKRWWEYLHKGAEKRHIDALSRVHNPTGRQTRHTNTTDQRNHPSLNWRNRKADPMPR